MTYNDGLNENNKTIAMAKRIAKSFIERLINHVDIVDVINVRVPLKKAGKNFQACCPFHHEKTPSFTVAPQKQFYYCFGCGAKGNAIGFLMDYEHLSFIDAVEKLAEESGLAVEYEQYDEAKAQQRKDLYDVLADTASLYEKNLFSTLGKSARQYLHERQLDKETSEFFRLGYSQNGNYLQGFFGQSATVEDLEKAGLLGRGDSGFYDQFRDRLMFPIRDPRGRVLGFGARALGDAKPKYLNSRETEVFSKRYVLYGLYETLQSTRHIEQLIVVEGYMDVIALHQHGIAGAVAALGTAFTPEHLALVKKHTAKIVICFDGDNAGKKAAQRAMETILPAMTIGLEIRLAFLPDGEDPDTLVRQIGEQAFRGLLDKGQAFSEFVFDQLIADSDMNLVEGRGEIANRAKTLFDGLPDSDYKSLLYENFIERSGIDVYQLGQKLQPKPRYLTREQKPRIKPVHYGYRGNAESRLIRFLLDSPEFAHCIEHVDMLSWQPSADQLLLKHLILLFQTRYSHNVDNENLWHYAFDGQQRQRLQDIQQHEHLVEKISIGETIEERKKRLKTDFIDSFNGLFRRIQHKIR